MPLTVVLAHAAFDEGRRDLLPDILSSWEGGVREVVEDHDRRGSWFTVRGAWTEALRLSGGAGHCLVAQDDFRMAHGGSEFLSGLCERNPDEVMCFRWPVVSDKWLHDWSVSSGAFWASSGFHWTGGALAVPAPLIAEFLDWAWEFDSLLTRPYRHHDDTREALFFLSRGVEVMRCRWSFLRHLGKWSVVRNADRPGDDEELGLVSDVSTLPSIADPRWDCAHESIPSSVYVPHDISRTVEMLLGDRSDRMGLEHVRRGLVLGGEPDRLVERGVVSA